MSIIDKGILFLARPLIHMTVVIAIRQVSGGTKNTGLTNLGLRTIAFVADVLGSGVRLRQGSSAVMDASKRLLPNIQLPATRNF